MVSTGVGVGAGVGAPDGAAVGDAVGLGVGVGVGVAVGVGVGVGVGVAVGVGVGVAVGVGVGDGVAVGVSVGPGVEDEDGLARTGARLTAWRRGRDGGSAREGTGGRRDDRQIRRDAGHGQGDRTTGLATLDGRYAVLVLPDGGAVDDAALDHVGRGRIDQRWVEADGEGEVRRSCDGPDLTGDERARLDLDERRDLDRPGPERGVGRRHDGSGDGRRRRGGNGWQGEVDAADGTARDDWLTVGVLPDVGAIRDGREQGVGVGRIDRGRVDQDGEIDRQGGRSIDPLLADDGPGSRVSGLVDDRHDGDRGRAESDRLDGGQRARDGGRRRRDRDGEQTARGEGDDEQDCRRDGAPGARTA